jgi:uracil-DNA glycosylase
MEVRIESTWKERLQGEFRKTYFNDLVAFVKEEYHNEIVYPTGPEIFNAFDHCPYDKVRVVILGQDPYHGPGQAHGLCFSVPDGVRQPPSLKNIFKEIETDVGKKVPRSGNLVRWADQGVLLLNATLTVRANSPGSHQNRGWETFTDSVVSILSDDHDGLVFMLWGAYAQRKGAVIDPDKHLVLRAAHPSPFAAHRGFFGCNHFSKANEYLLANGKEPIQW